MVPGSWTAEPLWMHLQMQAALYSNMQQYTYMAGALAANLLLSPVCFYFPSWLRFYDSIGMNVVGFHCYYAQYQSGGHPIWS